MPRAVGRQPLTVEFRVQSQASRRWIFSPQSGI